MYGPLLMLYQGKIMKKILIVISSVAVVAAFGTGTAAAQESVVYVPVDIFGCKYKEGKGSADLDVVVGKWNAYMDANDADDYAAWTMTKHYANPDQDFDVVWIGAHRNGTTMGEGADDWIANGGAVSAEFDAVLDCGLTGNYASRMFKAPPGGNVPESGVLIFTSCSLKEGSSYDDVIAGTAAWAKVLGDAGSKAAMYHWYPVYGTGENDIDWKVITSYPSHAELGRDYDRMGNGGLIAKRRELLGDKVDCDVARVYNAELRRKGKIRD